MINFCITTNSRIFVTNNKVMFVLERIHIHVPVLTNYVENYLRKNFFYLAVKCS